MANTVFDNKVIGSKVTDILSTKLDLANYLTVDNDLAEDAGMIKTVNVYTASGSVQDLAQGEGNTEEVSIGYVGTNYTVGTTQGRFVYFDEEAMKDPKAIEYGLAGLADTMVNDFTAKAIAEFDKATVATATGLSFNTIVDTIAEMNLEDESGLFLLINVADKAKLRKALGDDLKYVEAFVRSGYIGSVCGVPVYVSKAVPANKAFIATKDAVTLFIKKDTEVEQERDANTRKNTVYVRKVALVALTDATKVREINTTV